MFRKRKKTFRAIRVICGQEKKKTFRAIRVICGQEKKKTFRDIPAIRVRKIGLGKSDDFLDMI